jgi:hypothetical protein
MKRFILVLVLVLSASGLFATEYKKTYEKKNVYKDLFLYMFEMYEDNELLGYRIDTKQRPNYYKYIECTVVSGDKKEIMKLLSGLIDCDNNDYYKYISNYPGLTFLSDDYTSDGLDKITERYCYKIE